MQFRIDGLEPDTKYYFETRKAVGADGRAHLPMSGSFKTAPAGRQSTAT